ncbi:shufflon system plasmid conjugative transfer pilus tip adhesin PilV [Pseudomonas protegens]|uniref:Shufflon system plasmid conjugative transfer pilus tip adhesin PilV n=2 Tax=Pseudomonas protegens TaxID=380021 RepID=A0A2T6GBF4_9PSED|nr:shufflon system plasmid conjugative transfer pilus tip adhesin PilV [Pseudomonas protegens]
MKLPYAASEVLNKPPVHRTNKQRGFVSIEILGALVIVTLAALYGAEKYSEYLNEKEWAVAAQHATTFNEAAQSYIADKTSDILNKPLPYLITPALLIREGYLRKGFSEKNSFGQSYVTGVVKNNANAGKSKLQALTCSVSGSSISYQGLRSISSQIQGLGGYVDERNMASGAYGGWTSNPNDFGLQCQSGHIAIALSSEVLGSVLQESDRLYRFKAANRPELNRMYTAIDMGGNDVNNANGVNAKSVTAQGDIKSQDGWLVTQSNKGWLNSTYGGGLYMSDQDWIRSLNNKGIYTGGQLKGGTVRADGRLSTGEFLQLEGVAVENTACSPNGLVGRNAAGLTLSCQSGVWKGASASLGVDTFQTGIGPGGGWTPMDCPPGYVMTGMTAPMEDYKYIRCKKLQ